MRGEARLPREVALKWMVERRIAHAGYYGTRAGARSISPVSLPASVPTAVAAEINCGEPHPPYSTGGGHTPLGYHEVEHDGCLYGWWVRSSGTTLVVEIGAEDTARVWFVGRRHSIAEIWPVEKETGRPVSPNGHWYESSQRPDLLPFEVTT
jgi:hypothetical protein